MIIKLFLLKKNKHQGHTAKNTTHLHIATTETYLKKIGRYLNKGSKFRNWTFASAGFQIKFQ